MKNKTFLSRFSMALIGVFLLSTTIVFASELNYQTLDENMENGDLVSSKVVEQKAGWPKIQWPWNKGKSKDFEVIKERKVERMEKVLSKLVKEGTLTQEKSEEILKEYGEYIDSKKLEIQEKKSPFDQLVEEKILIQKEADAIKEALRQKITEVKKQDKHAKGFKKEIVNEVLLELVEDGVLTEDKIEEILKYYEEKSAKIKEMRKNDEFWNKLTGEGVITEEEVKKIKEGYKNFRKHDERAK